MIIIEDSLHCEWAGKFSEFSNAVAALIGRASVPWDQEPNKAPCTSWRTCGRQYRILEFDTSTTPWKLLRSVPILNISANGVVWLEGYKRSWGEAGGG